jgi:hypothetical protein
LAQVRFFLALWVVAWLEFSHTGVVRELRARLRYELSSGQSKLFPCPTRATTQRSTILRNKFFPKERRTGVAEYSHTPTIRRIPEFLNTEVHANETTFDT